MLRYKVWFLHWSHTKEKMALFWAKIKIFVFFTPKTFLLFSPYGVKILGNKHFWGKIVLKFHRKNAYFPMFITLWQKYQKCFWGKSRENFYFTQKSAIFALVHVICKRYTLMCYPLYLETVTK